MAQSHERTCDAVLGPTRLIEGIRGRARSALHRVVDVLGGVAPETGGGQQVVDEGLQRLSAGGPQGDEPFPRLVSGPHRDPTVADALVGDLEQLPPEGGPTAGSEDTAGARPDEVMLGKTSDVATQRATVALARYRQPPAAISTTITPANTR